jgi:hypothetical protein
VFDLENELLQIRDGLDAESIEYAVCGGLALGIHGFPRYTIDIDLLIRADDYARVEALAERLGFRFRANPMTFAGGATEIRRISKIDPSDGEVLMLDLLLVTPANEDAWHTRLRLPWHGGSLTVVSREGLIKLKLSRSSEQDLLDIKKLREES